MPQITTTNSTAYLVPLVAQNQNFDISLGGTTYHFRVYWSNASNAWVIDIQDSQQNDLITGIPLVTGCDLLEQYGYVGINGALVVQSTTDPDEVPTQTSLGSTGNLFFLIPTAGNA
jgi:hypothetical protein